MHESGHREPEDRLRCVDTVTAGQRYAGSGACLACAAQDFARDGRVELVERPAENRDRHDRLGAHRIDVADRVDGRDAAEVERIVHNRHEEVRRADDGLIVVDAIDGRVIACVVAHEQPRVARLSRHALENLGQHLR